MTNLNRRSLLAILASLPLFGKLIAQAQRRPPARKTRSKSVKLEFAVPPKWPTSPTPPVTTNPGVRLIFQGLTSFCHRSKECDIAFFKDDRDHPVEVRIFEITNKCREIFATTDATDPVFIQKISVEVEGQSSNVLFYNEPGDFDRITGKINDFRWLLDLDGIYGKKLVKNKPKTKLTVKNGQFYTYQRTNSTFKGLDGPFPADPGKDLGYIAKIMAADITLALGQSVLVKFNGNADVIRLKLNPGTRYEVYFSNECFKDDKKCTDSDFDLNFKFTKLLPQEQFKLKLITPGADVAPENLCITDEYKRRLRRLEKRGSRGTDRAPCMGAGFGEGDGFP